MIKLQPIRYSELNARQKEAYNFQKIAAILADYGFMTLRLSDDWESADFIAQHIDGQTFLKIQLKGRVCFYKKYRGKDLYIACPDKGQWYLYPHDELLDTVLAETSIHATLSWAKRGGYSFAGLSRQMVALLEPYRLARPSHMATTTES